MSFAGAAVACLGFGCFGFGLGPVPGLRAAASFVAAAWWVGRSAGLVGVEAGLRIGWR